MQNKKRYQKVKELLKKSQKQNVDTEDKAKIVYKCVRSLRATVTKL